MFSTFLIPKLMLVWCWNLNLYKSLGLKLLVMIVVAEIFFFPENVKFAFALGFEAFGELYKC